LDSKTLSLPFKTGMMINIEELLNSFSRFNIMIIGDVMVDTYLWGKVSRISPEAPVPVVCRTKSENRMGGAGNVIKNISSLGAKPVICTVIGKDETGGIFKQLLEADGISTKGIIESENRVTTSKTRVISGSQHLLRIDNEDLDLIDLPTEDLLIERVKSIIEEETIHAVIFQDYDKGVITPRLIEMVVELTSSKNIPTLVDPKKRNFLDYRHVSLFKPNYKEFVEGLNLDIEKGDIKELTKIAGEFRDRNLIDQVMVTLSEYGVIIVFDGSYHAIPAEVRDIADVSGAGDTVISMSALCMAAGLKPRQLAYLSNLAGGLVCEKVGVVPITRELLLKENFNIPEE
jgi:D-glycero-beta-D-manno-heptose-7-phosphate kinase